MARSVERAAKVLLWLADRTVEDGRAEQGLKEIAAGSGMDKATTYRIISALKQYGLVQRGREPGSYQLGANAMRLGFAAVDGHALIARCIPVLTRLAELTSETVSLSERQELRCVTIYEIESRQVVRYANTIGRSVPLHVAAGARCTLAFSDAKTIETVLAQPLEAYTEHTIVSVAALDAALADTRRRGYAVSHGERTEGVHSLAMPVFGADRTAVGSISVLWPSRGKRIDEARLRDWPRLLRPVVESLNSGSGVA